MSWPDRIDIEILRELQKNARLSNKELAVRVGLAASSCLERVRRLANAGFFRGFHADLDPRKVGVGLEAMITIRLAHHVRNQVESFRGHVLSLPEVVAVYHLTGRSDFLVHVAVRDLDHLRELALNAFTTREEVDQMETSVVFNHVRSHELPIYLETES
ncbi:MAG TPA: Lrp/AsnC family transcriptional regulator [Thermoanaerobaculia bacterium]|nr:Lrp/AsnC family transcriptional regulator [Thermoanaerobaculia bacterium]